MASKWRASTWGEEISLEYGKALRGHDQAHGQYRVFGSNGPIGWTPEPLADGPGVILGRKGAYRGVQYSREPFFVIDTAYYIVPKTETDMRWLYYAVKHYKLGEVDDGSPIPSTTRAAVYMLDVDVPPITEQRAIAHILGTLDDKIELNRRMNETLEAMARTLFTSWFVDFDPVRAKAEGRDPGLPNEIADIFPSHLVDSEFGEVPEGWHVVAFADVAQQGKGSVNPLSTPEQTFTHYSLPAFDAAQLPLQEPGEAIKSNKTPVPNDSVLVSKLNPHIPRIWLVGDAGDNAVCSTEFIVWTPKQPANSAFVYCLASSPEFNSAMRQLVTGTSNSHQRVKPEQLASIRAIAANGEAIAKFSAFAKPLVQRLLHHRQQSQTLASLRDALLPKLISGELRVSSTAEFMEDAI